MTMRRHLESLYAISSAILVVWFWCYLILKIVLNLH